MSSAKPKIRRFAEDTTVEADKSRGELEALLHKHGATQFALFKETEQTTIVYRIAGRMVRHVVRFPDAAPYERVDPAVAWSPRRGADLIELMRQKEWRRRWRALLLIVRAKLEMIASGESSIDREFMADMLLPNGETVGEAIIPRIAASYESGEMPPLFLGSGK